MQKSVTTIVVMCIVLMAEWWIDGPIGLAQTDGEESINTQLQADGWWVVYGNPIETAEAYKTYQDTLTEIETSQQPQLLLNRFFDEAQHEAYLTELATSSQLPRPIIDQMLIEAFLHNGDPIQRYGWEISAGILADDRQTVVTMPITVTTVPCQHYTPEGLIASQCEISWGITQTVVKQTVYRPYWRVRTYQPEWLPPPTTTSPPDGFFVQNNHPEDVVVAIAYLNPDNQWVSHGWQLVAPGETRRVYAGEFNSPYIAYYAKTRSDELLTPDGTCLFWVKPEDNWVEVHQSWPIEIAETEGYERKLFQVINRREGSLVVVQ